MKKMAHMTTTGMMKKRPKGIRNERLPERVLVPRQTHATMRVPDYTVSTCHYNTIVGALTIKLNWYEPTAKPRISRGMISDW